jgi:hypothetical protein
MPPVASAPIVVTPALRIERYSTAQKQAWDDFVKNRAVNGHLMHLRDFLEYHGDRFADHSLMFRHGDQLVAVLAAHRSGDRIVSHGGLTFGGLLARSDATAADVREWFAQLGQYLLAEGLPIFDYRPPPLWYHREVFELDLWALRAAPSVRVTAIPAAVVKLDGTPLFNPTRRNVLEHGRAMGWQAKECTTGLSELMTLVEGVLQRRHEAVPVHTSAQMDLLQSRFPREIRGYGVRKNGGPLVAGAILLLSNQVIKLQYLGYDAEATGAAEVLFDHLVRCPEFQGRWFDLGTVMRSDGVNAGLMAYKESIGGRLRQAHHFLLKSHELLPENNRLNKYD